MCSVRLNDAQRFEVGLLSRRHPAVSAALGQPKCRRSVAGGNAENECAGEDDATAVPKDVGMPLVPSERRGTVPQLSLDPWIDVVEVFRD
jgi:hypothetical protein